MRDVRCVIKIGVVSAGMINIVDKGKNNIVVDMSWEIYVKSIHRSHLQIHMMSFSALWCQKEGKKKMPENAGVLFECFILKFL